MDCSNYYIGYRKIPCEQRGKAATCIKPALCNTRAVDQVTARGQDQLESRLTPSQIPSEWI